MAEQKNTSDPMERLKRSFEAEPEVSGFRREEQMLPSHDGAGLYTVCFFPSDVPPPWPTVIQRSCYPHAKASLEASGELYARRGFAMVYQFCRGTGGSEGIWEPNVNERDDGLALTRWLAAQDWTGPMGYYGGSYLALTGWAMADAVPEKMKTMFLTVYGTQRHTSAWREGLFRQDILTAWAMGNAGHPVSADLMESCRYRPQVRVDEDLWGGKLSWYRDWITHPDRSDPYWSQGFWGLLREIPTRVKFPVFMVDGWYDHHLGSALEGWETLSPEAKAHSVLEIYPGNHSFQPAIYGHEEAENAEYDVERKALEWFTSILKKGEEPAPRVRCYIVGEDRWKDCGTYPFPSAGIRRFYLDGQALRGVPGSEGERSYDYDPDDPVPTLGAESLFAHPGDTGSREQPGPDWRQDVLTFVSDPLEEPVRILGKPKVRLFVRSDAPDTCFAVKLSEVFPDGRAFHIRNAVTTLRWHSGAQEPRTYEGGVEEIELTAWDVAWTLGKGSRLRLDVTSSNFPEYSVHPNTEELWSQAVETKTARQTVLFGGKTPACVELPLAQE